MTEQDRIERLRIASEDLTVVIWGAEGAGVWPETITELLRGKDALAREILLRERALAERKESA